MSLYHYCLFNIGLLDIGLVFLFISFLPSEKCQQCAKEIPCWNSSYTREEKVEGVIKDFYYCSNACCINAEK
jgi:hypothetical protein